MEVENNSNYPLFFREGHAPFVGHRVSPQNVRRGAWVGRRAAPAEKGYVPRTGQGTLRQNWMLLILSNLQPSAKK